MNVRHLESQTIHAYILEWLPPLTKLMLIERHSQKVKITASFSTFKINSELCCLIHKINYCVSNVYWKQCFAGRWINIRKDIYIKSRSIFSFIREKVPEKHAPRDVCTLLLVFRLSLYFDVIEMPKICVMVSVVHLKMAYIRDLCLQIVGYYY